MKRYSGIVLRFWGGWKSHVKRLPSGWGAPSSWSDCCNICIRVLLRPTGDMTAPGTSVVSLWLLVACAEVVYEKHRLKLFDLLASIVSDLQYIWYITKWQILNIIVCYQMPSYIFWKLIVRGFMSIMSIRTHGTKPQLLWSNVMLCHIKLYWLHFTADKKDTMKRERC